MIIIISSERSHPSDKERSASMDFSGIKARCTIMNLKTQTFCHWQDSGGIELQGSTRRESIKRLHTPGVEEGNRKPDTVAAWYSITICKKC